MKKTKKNNKGFSLVELIVVILIMAILGVALAPQVMRWVNNSRIATDASNYDALVDAAQIAAATNAPSADITITFNNSGVSFTGTDSNGFEAKMVTILPDLGTKTGTSYTGIKTQQNGSPSFVITVKTSGQVIKTTPATNSIS